MTSVGFTAAAPGGHRVAARPAGRLSLLVVDPGDDAGELAAAIADSCDVRICTSAAEGLLLAGSLRPDVVLVASDVPDVPAATVVRLLDRCCDLAVIVATDGGHAD